MDIFNWTLDPWSGMRQFRRELEGAFGRLSRAAGVRRLTPPLNVHQDEEGVTITAELPGVKDSDLSVEVENDRLRLKVARARPEDIKVAQYHRRERRMGEFSRELRLPAGLDAEKVAADLKNGLLTIHLPKAEAAKLRKIAVAAK